MNDNTDFDVVPIVNKRQEIAPGPFEPHPAFLSKLIQTPHVTLSRLMKKTAEYNSTAYLSLLLVLLIMERHAFVTINNHFRTIYLFIYLFIHLPYCFFFFFFFFFYYVGTPQEHIIFSRSK